MKPPWGAEPTLVSLEAQQLDASGCWTRALGLAS